MGYDPHDDPNLTITVSPTRTITTPHDGIERTVTCGCGASKVMPPGSEWAHDCPSHKTTEAPTP